MSTYGIDVSSYNGVIDWAKVKKAGCGHAVLKIARKELTVDKQFANNLAGCKAQGIPYGVYRYTYESTAAQAKKAAQTVVALLDKYGAAKSTIAWWDVEDQSIKSAADTTLTDSILAARKVVEAAGYGFGVYCNLDWYKNVLDTKPLDCPFWVARYPSTAEVKFGTAPAAKYKPSISHDLWGWQYSSAGVISGINHATDLNVVYGLEASNATPTPEHAEIKAFQQDIGTTPDGLYGPKTRKAAIQCLQKTLNQLYGCNLAVDGIWGPKTKQACKVIRKGDSGKLVKLIQGLLYCHGQDPGGYDGFFGDKTEAAVERFQEQEKILVDGLVGKDTTEHLVE